MAEGHDFGSHTWDHDVFLEDILDTDGEGDAKKLAFTFLPPEPRALPPASKEPALTE